MPPRSFRPGFMVLHSNQLEGLRTLLLAHLESQPLDPLTPEIILVQSNGMKNWVERALAEHLGICAGTELTLPATLIWRLYRQVLGPERVPADMPLDESALVWRLMRLLPQHLHLPSFVTLARYVRPTDAASGIDPLRLYSLCAELADVFDGYQNYRADWLEDWAAGEARLRQANGAHAAMPPDQAWQAALWQAVVADWQAEDPTRTQSLASRAQVHAAFMQALERTPDGQCPAGLPPRLIVFGISALPMQTVQALAALGRFCQVLMLVQNPCQYFWGDIVESHAPLQRLARRRQAEKPGWPTLAQGQTWDDHLRLALHTQGNGLLAAWGKQGRDYLHLLDAHDAGASRVDVFVDPVACAREEGREPSLLAQVQSGILNLEAPPQPRQRVAAQDHSVVMVRTHSARRELEVLHDRILDWLDQDATLKPQDITVMVPDMASFAPVIHAVFGRFLPGDPRHLPYAVADASPLTDPVMQAMAALLQLPELRLSRRDWRSWMDVPACRRRYGLELAQVDELDAWLAQANVRWGLDTPHRADFGLPSTLPDAQNNTWLFGLERLLLGFAQPAPHPWAGVMPQAGPASLDGPLLDALVLWLRDMTWALAQLTQAHRPSEWVALVQQMLARCFEAQDDREHTRIGALLAPLEAWWKDCQLAGFDEAVPLAVVREHWLRKVQSASAQQRFFGGGVQFATLMPMRSIPFRVVCLLGMNDTAYPRAAAPRGFDLMAMGEGWRAGDRSRREDDRYLFLEAVLAARDRLYISWQGRHSVTHAEQPPSPLVLQLQAHLEQGWEGLAEPALQPLHPFSPAYFSAQTQDFTYDAQWQAARQPSKPVTPVSPTAQATPVPSLDAQALVRLLRAPAQVYLRDRLGVRLLSPAAQSPDEESFGLDELQRYQLVEELLYPLDAPPEATLLSLRGELPLGAAGQLAREELRRLREVLHTHLAQLPLPPHPRLDRRSAQWRWGDLQLDGEWPLDARTRWWRDDGGHHWQTLLRPGRVWFDFKNKSYPRLDALAALWVGHLMANAAGEPTHSSLIGLDDVITLRPLEAAQAQGHLESLVQAYARAWASPMFMAPRSAALYGLGMLADPSQEPQAWAQARSYFDDPRGGEAARQPYLQRVLAQTQDMRGVLQHEWAGVYGGLLRALPTPSDASDSEADEESAA